jgi:AcrR family transcriptional regulator
LAATSRAAAAPIWARPEPAARNPRFSRQQIAAAALAIGDADGFEAVSMRRIAAALGAGTMSLYRYIETKDDLLALIDDAILAEALLPEPLPADWRDAIAAVARQGRRAFLNHPWVAQALAGQVVRRAFVGPGGLRHFEQRLAALDGAPLSLRGKLDLLGIIDDYVYGHVIRAAEHIDAAARGPQAEESAAIPDFVQQQLDSGAFPRLAALATDPAASKVSDVAELDARFEQGLRLLIGGAAATPAD